MKRYLTALFLLLTCHVIGQPKELTAEAALKDISDGKYFVRCGLKWMPDSCMEILKPFDVEVYYTWGKSREDYRVYDSIVQAALVQRHGELWDTLWKQCAVCFMNYYGTYSGPYNLDGDILDPNTAERHIKQGKLYFLTYGSLNSDALPLGFNECMWEVYESLGLEVKWIGGLDVPLAPAYNQYVMSYLDSIHHTSGTAEKAAAEFVECLDNWEKRKK